MITHADDKTFDSLVLESKRPVLVDFWAAWCGPCRMVAPEIEKLAAKFEGQIDVVKVDIDAAQGTAQRFGVMSIPTIAFFEPGLAPKGVVGFRPAEDLERDFGLGRFAAPAV
jgi:thioredoxin 1